VQRAQMRGQSGPNARSDSADGLLQRVAHAHVERKRRARHSAGGLRSNLPNRHQPCHRPCSPTRAPDRSQSHAAEAQHILGSGGRGLPSADDGQMQPSKHNETRHAPAGAGRPSGIAAGTPAPRHSARPQQPPPAPHAARRFKRGEGAKKRTRVHVDFASWQHGPAGRQGFAAAERTAPPRSQLAAAVRRAHSGVATMKMRRIIAPVTLVLNGLLGKTL